MFFVLLIQPNMFFFVFENKNCFSEFCSQTQFFFSFLKTQKIVLKNHFLEQFSKTATKQAFRTLHGDPNLEVLIGSQHPTQGKFKVSSVTRFKTNNKWFNFENMEI